MSRFYIPEKFFRPQNKNNLLAFFSFVDNETGLEYSNWRLIQGSNGHFVGSPSERYEHPEKGMQYYPHVRPAYDPNAENNRNKKGEKYMQALAEAVYEVYEKKNSAVVGASSGRGPVEEEEDGDLPF